MHYTNRFARTPNVKYIFSHAGGSIPYLAARFAIIDEMGFIAGGEQRGAAAEMFRQIYWDTALAASDPVLRMLRDVAGINQVLYGTDFPYAPGPGHKLQATHLAELRVEGFGKARHSGRQCVTPFFAPIRRFAKCDLKGSKCNLTSSRTQPPKLPGQSYIRSATKIRSRQPLCDRLSHP
jgi:hypothetical protein